MFKLSGDIFADSYKAVLLLWIIFSFFLCFMFVFVMLSCLFLAALCDQQLGKGGPLDSLVFVTF